MNVTEDVRETSAGPARRRRRRRETFETRTRCTHSANEGDDCCARSLHVCADAASHSSTRTRNSLPRSKFPWSGFSTDSFRVPRSENSEEERDIEMPVLVVCDRRLKCMWASPVLDKGMGHPWAATVVIGDLERLWYRKVILK